MNTLLQRCILSRTQRRPLSELQEFLSHHGTLLDREKKLSSNSLSPNMQGSDRETLGFTSAHKKTESLETFKSPCGDRTSHRADSGFAYRRPGLISTESLRNIKSSQRALPWFMYEKCGWRRTSMQPFHFSAVARQEQTEELEERQDLAAGEEGKLKSTVDPAYLVELQKADIAVYEELKDYVLRKHNGKPEFLKLLEEYNPLAEMKEPFVKDFRRPDRPLPPLDRVTIAVDTKDKYRVTRKTKWIVKQLRSPLMNDVPSVLEQWVKTMYPKRSDWLDLLQEFTNEKEQDLSFQVAEFALLEDTFEVQSQDLTRVLVKYINLERYDDVDRLMETLDSKGFPPDFVVCTLLMDMNCKLKRLDKAREMYDRIRSIDYVPDVTACTKLIEFYCSSGNPEAGAMILEEMLSEKVYGTVETYLAVLKGYGKQGKLSAATKVFLAIKEDYFLRQHMGPQLYSALLSAYVQANTLPSALLTLEDMLVAGLEPEDECLNELIAAFEKKNQFERALDVLLKLESKAIRPGVDTLITLVGWFGKLGLVEEAEILFEVIKGKVDAPASKAYASLFSVYARAGSLEKARAVVVSAEEKKVVIDADSYEKMILSLLAGKQVEEAQAMQEQMISKGYTPSDEVERALLGIQTESSLFGVVTGLPEEASDSSGLNTESFLSNVSKPSEEEAGGEGSGTVTENVVAGLMKSMEEEKPQSL